MATLPVIIYSTYDVPRLRYIAGLILGEILGLKWQVVTDKRKLGKNPVINYSGEIIRNAFKVKPVPLLFEKEIRKQEISVIRWNNLPVFFSTETGSDFPFDIFAASFFLVTRYEEYLDQVADENGGFKASSSVAFENGFLQVPVIDLWIREFARAILKKFQILTFKQNQYRALLTIDADQPLESQSIFESIGVLLDFKKKDTARTVGKDHQDRFNYIIESIETYRSDARFFFAVGNNSRYDKNPSWKNEKYRLLINNIAGKYETGLNPSFNASSNFSVMSGEVMKLKKILSRDVTSGRLHYVKSSFPDFYRNILKAGITSEFSMGYHDEPGFRAGLAQPFYFFDVSADECTGLRVVPFQFSDNLFTKFRNLQTTDIILKLIQETRKAGGLFVSTWHNSSLAGREEMKDRREVFEFMLKNQAP